MPTPRRTLATLTLFACTLPSFGQVVYCTQSIPTSVPGCTPVLSAPDPTLASGSWDVSPVPIAPGDVSTNGIFIYNNGVGIGQSTFNVTTGFGQLCIGNLKRSFPACAMVQFNGPTNSCIGTFSLPLLCNGGALGIAVGDDVNVQCWYRDPGIIGKALFTHAIYYTVQ